MRNHNALAAVVPIVLAAAGQALGAEPQGPPLGTNSYSASIVTVCAVPDTDDYAGALVAGEKLSVTVAAAKGSALVPQLTLVAPDGTEIMPAPLAVKRGGKTVSLRRFPVPTTGRWAVRVAGGATEGAYTVAFGIERAPAVVLKKVEIDGSAECVIPFEGLDGARVDVAVTWSTRKSSARLASILDPVLRTVPGVGAVERANGISVKGLVLSGGNGTYQLRLDRTTGAPVCNIAVRVAPQGRPSRGRTVKLSDVEPYLDVVGSPVRGIAGVHVRLAGGNFSPDDPPTVLFDTKPATAFVVPGGTTLDVLPPEAPDGSVVSVTVIGSDGQSCAREGYFHYVAMPLVQDLVDDHNAPVRIVAAAGGTALFVRGTGFENGQQVSFGAVPVPSAIARSATRFELVSPPLVGRVRVSIRDEFGRTSSSGFEIECVAPPEITSVVATSGALLDAFHVSANGGASVAVWGANFLASDKVTLGGAACTLTSAAPNKVTFTTPAIAPGLADLVVTDVLGGSVTVTGALHAVEWTDSTDLRSPGRSAVDALTASRGAVGDLDGDGAEDDLVLVSATASPGTRQEFTRVFLGSSGTLEDVTAQNFPAAKSDAAGVDEWKASALALGDLDGDESPDVLIGGAPVATAGGAQFEARLFKNDGSGAFSRDSASPKVRTAAWTVTDYDSSAVYPLFTPLGTNGGRATALGVDDLDGDGDGDIVLGTDRFRTGTAHIPLAGIWFEGDDAYATGVSYQWDATGTTLDAPALRIFENRRTEGEGFVDRTFTRLPSGEESPGRLPAYHVRDLKLGDVDGDGTTDIVLTWDDPTSVTPYGLVTPGGDQARTATRVLLNDGSGAFTDATDTWMPAPMGSEFWQADRLLLTDLDDDGDLDLALLHHESIDAYTAAPTHSGSALRVLRNNGTSFVDATATAVPRVQLLVTTDDNLRGTALAALDFDGDGVLDLAVGTTESIAAGTGRSTRLLRGQAGFTFLDASGFLPTVAKDTGEACDLVLGDLAGGGEASLLLVTTTQPAKSAGNENLRVLDWTE